MTTVDTSSAPPLERVAPYFVAAASGVGSLISVTTRFLAFSASQAAKLLGIFSPIPVALYLLAPLVVFLEIATDVLVRWPYQVTLYAFDNLHPIYVFCGVTCIVGGLVGITGRLVAGLLVNFVNNRIPEEPENMSRVKHGKRVARRSRSE